MTTGKVIKFLRQQKGLTQSEFSEILGVKKSSVQKYENGSVNNLKIDVIRKLIEFFHVQAWIFIFPERIGENVEDLKNVYLDDDAIYAHSQYRLLDDVGRKKLKEYVKDLVDSGNYQRKM